MLLFLLGCLASADELEQTGSSTHAVCTGPVTLEAHPDPDLERQALTLAICPSGWRNQ